MLIKFKKTLLLALVSVASGYIGYQFKDDTVLVAGLTLPDYLSSSYEDIHHLYPISDEATGKEYFSRVVTKDEYIKWLEEAVFVVKTQESLKAVKLANQKLSDFIESTQEISIARNGKGLSESEKRDMAKQLLCGLSEGIILASGDKKITTQKRHELYCQS